MAIRLVRLPEVLRLVGFCKSQLYALIAAGEFKPPIKIRTSSFWAEDEIVRWIEARIAASQGVTETPRGAR